MTGAPDPAAQTIGTGRAANAFGFIVSDAAIRGEKRVLLSNAAGKQIDISALAELDPLICSINSAGEIAALAGTAPKYALRFSPSSGIVRLVDPASGSNRNFCSEIALNDAGKCVYTARKSGAAPRAYVSENSSAAPRMLYEAKPGEDIGGVAVTSQGKIAVLINRNTPLNAEVQMFDQGAPAAIPVPPQIAKLRPLSLIAMNSAGKLLFQAGGKTVSFDSTNGAVRFVELSGATLFPKAMNDGGTIAGEAQRPGKDIAAFVSRAGSQIVILNDELSAKTGLTYDELLGLDSMGAVYCNVTATDAYPQDKSVPAFVKVIPAAAD
jgi:hypothetical protein